MDTSNFRNLSGLSKDDQDLLEYIIANSHKTDEELANDERLSNFEKVQNLTKQVNPYLKSVPCSANRPFTFSFTNMREEYIRKFTLTAISGYIYRMLDEYKVDEDIEIVPEENITKEDYEKYAYVPWDFYDKVEFEKVYIQPLRDAVYTPPNSGLTEAQIAKEKTLFNHEMAEKIIAKQKERKKFLFMHKHCILKSFIDKLFRYNPDRHVRSAYAEPTYMAKQDEILGSGLRASQRKKMSKYRNQLISGCACSAEEVISYINNNETHSDGETCVHCNTIIKKNKFTENIPPRDVFLRLHRYIESNYEKIQEAVKILYHETPDLDVVLNVHEIHNNMDEAKAYREKYRDTLITDIMVAETGQYVFLAPYKENRNKREFLNKDTRHLEEILRQKEADLKIGRDMLRKRVALKKAKNVKEEGDDAEMIKEYQTGMNTLKGGATKGKYVAGETKYDPSKSSADIDPDLPDDAIQLNTYHITDSGKTLQQENVFIKAQDDEDGEMVATIHRTA